MGRDPLNGAVWGRNSSKRCGLGTRLFETVWYGDETAGLRAGTHAREDCHVHFSSKKMRFRESRPPKSALRGTRSSKRRGLGDDSSKRCGLEKRRCETVQFGDETLRNGVVWGRDRGFAGRHGRTKGLPRPLLVPGMNRSSRPAIYASR